MKNRRLLASAALLTSTAVLCGCGVLPGSGEDRKTVTVWLMKDSASASFLKRFTEDFEKQHDDLKVEVEIQSWNGIVEKVGKALKGGPGVEVPDVVEVGNTQVARYVDQGGLYDLTLESMRDFGMDDWLPGLAEPGRFNGTQYGVPWYAANRVVIYNKELFDQAGIAKPPRDRAEWLHDTDLLNRDGNQGIYLAGQDWYTLSGFIWDEGGDLAKDTGAGWKGSIDSPKALAGMDFYAQLQALGKGPKTADEEHPPQTQVFAKGGVGQIIAVPGAASLILEQNPELKGKLGFFPVPGKTAAKPGAVFTGGSDLVVTRRSDNHAAALKVVAELAGERWQKDLARTMNYVPNKTTLAGAVSDEPGAAAMAKGAKSGHATPNSPRWARVEADNPIKTYMTKVLTGGDKQAAAREASKAITKALDVNRTG
ncbi:extracellular solute-binding protein [Streptomyces sp. NPDC004959]|uniref:extracellular solute-binding protein n=1 Tax=unclassified Streptomyces TaxID=2593676 RepID=UPI0004C62CCA|nr:extracellular solute-binding protein [Streptomyces sp. NRRL F-5630]